MEWSINGGHGIRPSFQVIQTRAIKETASQATTSRRCLARGWVRTATSLASRRANHFFRTCHCVIYGPVVCLC